MRLHEPDLVKGGLDLMRVVGSKYAKALHCRPSALTLQGIGQQLEKSPDAVVRCTGFQAARLRRRTMPPMKPRPASIIATLVGSGTAAITALSTPLKWIL
jgi:hypothetical protein